jgi:hypothetical protein
MAVQRIAICSVPTDGGSQSSEQPKARRQAVGASQISAVRADIRPFAIAASPEESGSLDHRGGS